jgi:hypothetical protein
MTRAGCSVRALSCSAEHLRIACGRGWQAARGLAHLPCVPPSSESLGSARSSYLFARMGQAFFMQVSKAWWAWREAVFITLRRILAG